MISFAIGLIGALVALIGWFGFHSLFALIIGTALYVLETLMEIKELNGNAIGTDFLIFAIGAAIGFFMHIPFYIGGMIAIAIYNLIISIVSIPTLIAEIHEKNLH